MRRRGRGLTLVELAIGIAIVALLAAVAVPGMAQRIARERLVGAAEGLASDLAEARFEAARAGQPLHLVFGGGGTDWCYAVARAPGCDCRAEAPACALRVVRATEFPGVDLLAAADAAFDPAATEPLPGGATLRGAGGTQSLQVDLSPLGRARVCSPSGLAGYPGC